MSIARTFCVSTASVVFVFILSMSITILIGFGLPDTIGVVFIGWSFESVFMTTAAVRAIVVFAVAIVPFRQHLQERPSLVFVTVGASFAATLLPWIALGEVGLWQLKLTAAMHAAALILFWTLMWKDHTEREATR